MIFHQSNWAISCGYLLACEPKKPILSASRQVQPPIFHTQSPIQWRNPAPVGGIRWYISWFIGFQIWLVVWTPLKNMKVSWGYSSQKMESHKIPWFQSPPTRNAFNLYLGGLSDCATIYSWSPRRPPGKLKERFGMLSAVCRNNPTGDPIVKRTCRWAGLLWGEWFKFHQGKSGFNYHQS